jgi:hypothetical protein
MAHLVKLPAELILGPGMIIESISLGMKCPHCEMEPRAGDSIFCPHVADQAVDPKAA